jgi:hypothetical protein
MEILYPITDKDEQAISFAVGIMREAAQKLHGHKRLERELKEHARLLDALSTNIGHKFQLKKYDDTTSDEREDTPPCLHCQGRMIQDHDVEWRCRKRKGQRKEPWTFYTEPPR